MKEIKFNKLLILLFLAAIFALTFAYISQYFFGLKPCFLCLQQRKPFFAIILLCLSSFLFFKSIKSQKIVFILCLVALLSNCLIATYHVGVEQKIFTVEATCSSPLELEKINDIKKLEESLLNIDAVKCDKAEFIFLKLSMAAWNLIYCLSLLFISIFLRKKWSK